MFWSFIIVIVIASFLMGYVAKFLASSFAQAHFLSFDDETSELAGR